MTTSRRGALSAGSGHVRADRRLFGEIAELIERSKREVAAHANSALTMLFWRIGRRIGGHILGRNRARYGARTVANLSRRLTLQFGVSFEEKNLRRMMQFAEVFPDEGIVVTLSRQLSWSHVLVLLPLKNEAARRFYATEAMRERWGVRELRASIDRKVFERKSLAALQMRHETQSGEAVFKDPYLLDFLGLKEGYLESDLETMILRELEQFLLELGTGFSFVARQKRMVIDGEDHYLDLLFFHRRLKRLVAVELKIGRFQAAHKGQMELYLRWLARHESQPAEHAPIGLILCAEASREQVELLEMYKDGIMVAEYWTELLPRKQLESRLHTAMAHARELQARRAIADPQGEPI